jgi:hypothetical protein
MSNETPTERADRLAREVADLVPADEINRMRVSWKKGRQMFESFFTQLDAVRKQIGDDERFAHWTFDQLKIGVGRAREVAAILHKDDAKRVKEELRRAKDAEQAQRYAERKAETVAKHEAREKPKPLSEAEAVAFLRARGYTVAVTATVCPIDGKPLKPGQTYCSGRCRVAAYRQRQRGAG